MSTVQSPTHIYISPGIYTVSLTTKDSAGSVTATSVITVAAPPPLAFHLIASILFDDGSTETYTYNSSNQLIKDVYSYPNPNTYTYFNYYSFSGSTVKNIGGEINNGITTSDTVIITLNSAGLGISSIKRNGYSNIQYDANGFCTNWTSIYTYLGISTTTVNTYSYSNGNMILSTQSGNPVTLENVTYNDKPNSIGNKNIGMTWQGKDNTNLTLTDSGGPNSNVGSSPVSYTYTYNDNGTVQKKTTQVGTASSNYTTWCIYTYQ